MTQSICWFSYLILYITQHLSPEQSNSNIRKDWILIWTPKLHIYLFLCVCKDINHPFILLHSEGTSFSSTEIFKIYMRPEIKSLIPVVRDFSTTPFPTLSDWSWHAVTHSRWLRPPILCIPSSVINTFTQWPIKDGDTDSRTWNVPGPCRSHYRN